jgi:multidrug efflux pump subunit AcrB
MLNDIIAFFARRHFLTNFLMLLVFVGGVFSWQATQKEEWPDITMDSIRISVTYPGAPAEDVEYFVTKPIEEEVRGLDGIRRVTSTSSVGQSNVTVELEPNYAKVDEALTEVRSAVLDVSLPEEVIDDPNVRVFRSSKKAILDIGIIFKEGHLLTDQTRRELQGYAFTLESQLLNLPQVNTINKQNYLNEELLIKSFPSELKRYDIPFNTVMREVRENHVRKPAGTLETVNEPKVTLDSELDTVDKLKNLVIQGGFEGRVIRLGEVAEITQSYEKNKEITIINGREGVMFSVVKNSSYGILETRKAVLKFVDQFRKNVLRTSPVELVLLDDESIDLRNRLSIISMNGIIGFVLIIITLFIFLNKQAGVWVAMGIPFTICFTLIFGSLMGMTINGTTLAAVIIVLGIIVDDAIVVGENITRLFHQGLGRGAAVIKGTSFVMLPIFASITTTCVAFVPLLYFEGRFGKFVMYIPPIIFLMLLASLIESLFILPGHMDLKLPLIGELRRNEGSRGHWFEKIEGMYGHFLKRILPAKIPIIAGFVVMAVAAFYFAGTHMKYVMFPNEETRDIVLTGEVASDMTRFETALKSKEIEDLINPYIGKEVVGLRTRIAHGRRGGAVEENKFWMLIEIVPKEKRKKSADKLVTEFKEKISKLNGFENIKFQKSRWGQDSGSSIELLIQDNNDATRLAVAKKMADIMSQHKDLQNIEIDVGLRVPEYKIDIKQEVIKRLSISPADIASTFRAALEGVILYEFTNGNEDVRTRFTIADEAKTDIEQVLDLPVENQGNYLVPLRDLVTVTKGVSPNSISRRDMRRTTLVDAGIKPRSKATPLAIALHFEKDVFPLINQDYPSTTLTFSGEIEDTRESARDFVKAIWLTVILIFSILAILFHSVLKPLLIMLAIPFGLVGIIIAFVLHGKMIYGFYSVVGALGLAGVVINDSIIMLTKLENEFNPSAGQASFDEQIASIAQTRLRAVLLTTLTTVVGVLPTAYGFAGYDSMLAEMMLTLAWGLIFGSIITLILIPFLFSLTKAKANSVLNQSDAHAQ